MRQSLAGRTIVVTRPAGQADSLCAQIEACGGHVLRFPVLGIAPPLDDADLASATVRLDAFHLAFFVSPNAVEHAVAYILARREWPAELAVATVGKGSAATLHDKGFARVLAPCDGFDSEAVLELPEFSAAAVQGRNIVIFRGDGGRDLLGQELSRRGARIEYVTAYRRYAPDSDPALLLAPPRPDAMVLTSSEGVRNLAHMLGADGVAALQDVLLFVPHARIAGFAREAGFRRIIETGPGDEGIVAGLVAMFSADSQGAAGGAKSF